MRDNASKNLSTGIYVRVSTEEQAQEGYSIRGQTEKLKSYALLKDWDIFDIYADEGISGKNIIDRPAINRLIEDISDGKVNNVLVFKVDRLTRSTKNLLELVELFDECNCCFNSLSESIDTDTPSGRMFLKIIGIFAEFERENIALRSRLGRERKVKEGYTIASWSLSYGYERENGEKIQTIIPHEAMIVKEVFSMYIEKSISMNEIARILNRRRIPTKMSSQWNCSTIRHMLMNPTYVGRVRKDVNGDDYFEAEGKHEPIISDEIFDLVQQKIANLPNKTRTKIPREESYFCGTLVCGRCKSKFTTHNYKAYDSVKKYKTSYRCRAKKGCAVDRCTCPDISHQKVELAFYDYIQNINDISEIGNIEIEENSKLAEQEILKSVVENERKLDTMQKRKNQVMEQYMQGDIEFDEYKRMIKVFNDKSEVLEIEIQQKKAELSDVSAIPEILPSDVVLNLKQNWEKLSDSEKVIFLQRFVKSITVTVEKITHARCSVKINSIEFYNCELPKREKVRKQLR